MNDPSTKKLASGLASPPRSHVNDINDIAEGKSLNQESSQSTANRRADSQNQMAVVPYTNSGARNSKSLARQRAQDEIEKIRKAKLEVAEKRQA